MRWKDINYWAIKDTVEKSHKTLHKFMREYQDALDQPVLPCLHNTGDLGSSSDVGIWDKPQKENKIVYYIDESIEHQNYLYDTNLIQVSYLKLSGIYRVVLFSRIILEIVNDRVVIKSKKKLRI